MNSYLLSAAISGIVLGAIGVTNELTHANTTDLTKDSVQLDETGKHACKGQNGCKGQGGCKTDKNGCKGHNECKGQGGCRTDGQEADKGGKSSCSGPNGCRSK